MLHEEGCRCRGSERLQSLFRPERSAAKVLKLRAGGWTLWTRLHRSDPPEGIGSSSAHRLPANPGAEVGSGHRAAEQVALCFFATFGAQQRELLLLLDPLRIGDNVQRAA